MKVGFTVMILQQNSRVKSGEKFEPTPKKQMLKGLLQRQWRLRSYCTIGSDNLWGQLINIPKKRPDSVGRWKLHHDNARSHVANTVLQFPANKKSKLPYPPYSPT
ncbi:hypothetical protein J6590_101261 [Homalodisca vitripennis]|nr:hypothetical protein J6590_101261 [Homalodisca vitripennis]